MKSTFLKIGLGLLMVGAVVAVIVLPRNSFADPVTYDVTGQAFSDMPNSADQEKTPDNHYGGRGLGYINMSGSNYGVTLNPTTGKFSGYGWNELGGYVEFAPAGLTGASIVPNCLDIKTNTCPVSGFIRFVSYVDPQSGGWDGQVKMSDLSWNVGVTLGKEIAGVRTMSGYAWGGDVVGWVDFSGVKVNIITDTSGCTDSTALNHDPLANKEDGSCCYTPNTWNPTTKQCIPPPVTDCKIQNDPKYNSDPLVGEDNSKCQCPNGDYNSVTKQCGTVIVPDCPIPAPNPNFPGMITYNSKCPIICKPPMTWNDTKQICEKDDGDICPTTMITYPGSTAGNVGTNDPNTTPINTTMPVVGGTSYTLHDGNKCGIADCNMPFAYNYNPNPNPNATILLCTYCKPGTKKDPVTNTCVACPDPKDKNECPVPPKGTIKPIYIES